MGKYRIEIKWALIFTAMMLLWLGLERLVGLHGPHIDQHATYTNLVAIPSILIYIFALRDKREYYFGGSMTFGQGFLTGSITSLIIALLSPAAQYLAHTVITPDYFTNVANYAVESGQLSRSVAANYFTLGNYILQSAIGALVMGLVTSAVVAYFLRDKTRTPSAQ